MPPAELQRTAAVHLFDLRQVRLRRDHHAWYLAVHEVLLRRERERRLRCRSSFAVMCARFYLEDRGAVLEGVRVADIVEQADDVTGQIGLRQGVEVREHFMKLRGGGSKTCQIVANNLCITVACFRGLVYLPPRHLKIKRVSLWTAAQGVPVCENIMKKGKKCR